GSDARARGPDHDAAPLGVVRRRTRSPGRQRRVRVTRRVGAVSSGPLSFAHGRMGAGRERAARRPREADRGGTLPVRRRRGAPTRRAAAHRHGGGSFRTAARRAVELPHRERQAPAGAVRDELGRPVVEPDRSGRPVLAGPDRETVTAPARDDQRAAVVAGFLGWTLDAFDFFLVVMTLTAIAKDFGRSDADIAFTLTLTLVFRPVGAFIFGLIADRYGRKIPLMADLVFYSVIEVFSGLAQSYTTFLVLRALFVRARVRESEVWQQTRHDNWLGLGRAIAANWKVFLYLTVLMAMMNMVSHGTQDMYPTFLQRDWGFSPTKRAALTAFSQVGALTGGILCGLYSDRLGRRRTIALALLGAVLAIPIWAFAPSLPLLVAGAF